MAEFYLICNLPFLFGLVFFTCIMASSKAHTLWSGVSALFLIGGLGLSVLLLMVYGIDALNLTQNSLFMLMLGIVAVLVLALLLFLFLIGGLGLSVLLLMVYGIDALNLTQNSLFMLMLGIVAVLVLALLLFFPFLFIAFLFLEGIRLIRREGFSLTNCLLIGFAILLTFSQFVLPFIMMHVNNDWLDLFYLLFSLLMAFFSIQLAVFVLSAFINLIHFSKKKKLSQIVVLGSGIFGTEVPPLLQARIQAGIDLQKKNPNALLILSGGQGKLSQIVVLGSGIFGTEVPPLLQARIQAGIDLQKKNPNALLILSGGQGQGEDIPEGQAMKSWALDHGADPTRTISEERSRNTRENLLYSADLFKDPGGRTAIVTKMKSWALDHGADPTRTISEERSRNTRENLLYSADLFKDPGGRTAIVTNRYHVFRALMLGRELGMPKLYGYGAKTKWYFELNATLREFAAYLKMTERYHVFRALMLGRELGMPKLYGYGAKTKWYFELNATLREFAAYLKMTEKRQLICALMLGRELGMPKLYGYGAKTKWYFELNATLREFAAYLKMTEKRQLICVLFICGFSLFPILLNLILN